MGDFVSSDLPNGLNFPVLLEEAWFQNPEFEVEIRTNGLVYAGILAIGEAEENSAFSISGSTTVYNCRNPADHLEIECTILVEDPNTVIEEENERRNSMMTRETQTEKWAEPEKKPQIARDRETQTLPSPTPTPPPPPPETSEASTMTTEPHLNLEDLEPILTASIARHLKEHREHRQESGSQKVIIKESEAPKPSEDVVEDPMPSRSPLIPSTYNLMPRVAKLRDLDKIIAQKEEILEKLNLEIETKRKIQKIRESRVDSEGKKIIKSEDVVPKKLAEVVCSKPEDVKAPNPEVTINNPDDVQPQSQTVEVSKTDKKKRNEQSEKTSESTTSTSKTSSSETETSDSESESTSESTSTSESESSSSSSSQPSSKETVRAVAPQVRQKQAKADHSDGESTIEDPFSSRQPEEKHHSQPEPEPETSEEAISPTTAYINNLRQNMLNQYLQKYN